MEVELKIPVKSFDAVEKRLKKLGAKLIQKETIERDVFFDDRNKLTKQNKALRVRFSGKKVWLTYKCKITNQKAKVSQEEELLLSGDPTPILEGLGYKVNLVKLKKRKAYSLKGVTICLDGVQGLGRFVELEVISTDTKSAIKKLNSTLKSLGFSRSQTTNDSYAALLRRKHKKKKR